MMEADLIAAGVGLKLMWRPVARIMTAGLRLALKRSYGEGEEWGGFQYAVLVPFLFLSES